MDKVILKARAKINLSLDVLGKRPDGYHNVKMLMQTVDLGDDILVSTADEGIKIKCNLKYVPTDERNIVYKIAHYVKETYNIKSGIYISLRKNIPVSAGLGGGSADGAAVLSGLNKMFKLNLSIEELMDIGEKFGADIPYCLLGGTALAEGIGEKITMLSSLPKTAVLICKPHTHISTKYVYSKLDLSKVGNRPNIDFLVDAINKKDIKTLAQNMGNVLESVTAEEKPEIKSIKKILFERGAMGSIMSGSGTSVFGIFENKMKAYKAVEHLRNFSKEIFVTNTFNAETIEK